MRKIILILFAILFSNSLLAHEAPNNFDSKNLDKISFIRYNLPIKNAQIEAIKIINASTFWITSEDEGVGYPRLFKIKI